MPMAGLPRSLLPGVLRTALSAVLLLCAARAVPAAGVFPAAQWATPSVAEPSHWSEAKLKVADAFAASIKSDAYLVIDKGVLVHAYGDIDKPMNLASVRKSVQSVLYGIHVGRGEIDLDQTLGQLGIGDKDGLSDTERTATVRQLLQLRSGVYHPAAYETAQAKAERPARGSHAPGEFWYYNNWDANVLGTIFERRTGRSVFEALRTDLAEPLQFQDFRYPQDTESRLERSSEHPAQVMHLSARDLARIGLLMARDGMWHDKRIVPAGWVTESTTSYTTVGPGWSGYGYLWWVPLKGFPFWQRGPNQLLLAVGAGGQFMMVDRKRDLVVVHRVDNSKGWFQRSEVRTDQFAVLAAHILAAAPVASPAAATPP